MGSVAQWISGKYIGVKDVCSNIHQLNVMPSMLFAKHRKPIIHFISHWSREHTNKK